MRVRTGFSPLPRRRFQGTVGVALAAALVAGSVAGAETAQAAPSAPARPAAASAGELTAPNIASARAVARLQGKRVEVIGERTPTSSTFALPDGTMSTGNAGAPIWVRKGGDGTHPGDWAAVDLTLEFGPGESVRPKAHPLDPVLAGGGAPKDGLLVSMHGNAEQSVGLEWSGPLPKPRLEGPRAVYPEARPGVDLVVEATRTGFEQFFVLTRKPSDTDAPDLHLRLRATGLTAAATADGGVQFKDKAGKVMGSSGTPLAWDAGVDAERLHPVGQPWKAAEPATSLAPHPDWGRPSPAAKPSTPSVTKPSTGKLPTDPHTPPMPEAARVAQ